MATFDISELHRGKQYPKGLYLGYRDAKRAGLRKGDTFTVVGRGEFVVGSYFKRPGIQGRDFACFYVYKLPEPV